MTILAAGSEKDIYAGTVGSPTSTTYTMDSNFVRAGIRITSSQQSYFSFAGQTELWTHFEQVFWGGGGGTWGAGFEWNDVGAGQTVVRIYAEANVWYLEYWNGTGFTRVSSPDEMGANNLSLGLGTQGVRNTVDVYIKIASGTAGILRVYVNKLLRAEFVDGDTLLYTPTDNINEVRCNGISGTHYMYQWLIQTTSTIGCKVATIYPNAAGTTSDFTGAYTAIDEGALWNDGDFISSTVADDVSTFGFSNLSATAQALDVVVALVTYGRMQRGSTGPQNAQFAIYSGAANYFSSNVSGLVIGFLNFNNIWTVDPATSVAWTPTNVNAVEMGVKSIT